jgi:hypothetical protein
MRNPSSDQSGSTELENSGREGAVHAARQATVLRLSGELPETGVNPSGH